MKTIGLHANGLDDRGNSTVIYDYARAIKEHLGHEVVITSNRTKSISVEERFAEFKVDLYDDVADLPSIIDRNKIDTLYMTKAGNVDGICPANCRTAIHCVFDMREQHGTVYAGVSEWLAKFFGKDKWVPHIIDVPQISGDMRDELGIPKDALVFGRHGGKEQFNVPFVPAVINSVLNTRPDVWFVFLNTNKFIDHPRVKFIPFIPSKEGKTKFINTCDAMLHARADGETFGLAVAEFSALNKPVITYDADYWWYMKAHLDMLGEKALKYRNGEELFFILTQITKSYINDTNWDCYSKRFSPKEVITQFNQVFL